VDPLWLLIALICGFVAQQFRLPPLVGFLLAGFILHGFGEQGGALLDAVANLGITLLLFSIGLKLRLKDLIEAEVWGTATVHMLLTITVISGLLLLLGLFGLTMFVGLSPGGAATIGFALSFSSTVFAVKILEERGELKTRHGQVAIGVLIIQDLIAVVFLMAANQSLPSPWALALLLLPWFRPILNWAIEHSGYGEVLVLFGLAAAVAGGELFDIVGMKDGLGALAFGVLLSAHSKAAELSRSLMSFKDLFLIGFFLSIGMNGLPEPGSALVIIGLVAVLLPFKMLLFIWLMTRLRLRIRSAFLAMLGLASFSEFGLIVAAEGAKVGWIGQEWLVYIAIALALSFVIASLLNARAHELYTRVADGIGRFESPRILSGDEVSGCGAAKVLIVGMGRVGRGAYNAMRDLHGDEVLGVDVDRVRTVELEGQGFKIITGDAEELKFWRRMMAGRVELIMLALPTHEDSLLAVKLLNELGYKGIIGAVAKHEDERAALEAAGIHATFNYYAEVGKGFADHVTQIVTDRVTDGAAG
jgi:glutathione-regulated potassium-efflux system ancillary protein KefC